MTGLRSTDWFSNFDLFQQEAHRAASSQVHLGEDIFFVDVGGGHGHQCIQLRDKYPHLQGRLVLQDLPEAVNHLPSLDGVRVMAHDIFQPQTIKGMYISFFYKVPQLRSNLTVRFNRSKVLLPATNPARLPRFPMYPNPSTSRHCHGIRFKNPRGRDCATGCGGPLAGNSGRCVIDDLAWW